MIFESIPIILVSSIISIVSMILFLKYYVLRPTFMEKLFTGNIKRAMSIIGKQATTGDLAEKRKADQLIQGFLDQQINESPALAYMRDFALENLGIEITPTTLLYVLQNPLIQGALQGAQKNPMLQALLQPLLGPLAQLLPQLPPSQSEPSKISVYKSPLEKYQ